MRLKHLRKLNNETQKQLADLLQVSLRTVQYYENGSVTIPNDTLKKIAEHYLVSVSEIFGEPKQHVNLQHTEVKEIAHYVVNNWDIFMQNALFNANFKAKAGEWALQIKKEDSK